MFICVPARSMRKRPLLSYNHFKITYILTNVHRLSLIHFVFAQLYVTVTVRFRLVINRLINSENRTHRSTDYILNGYLLKSFFLYNFCTYLFRIIPTQFSIHYTFVVFKGVPSFISNAISRANVSYLSLIESGLLA